MRRLLFLAFGAAVCFSLFAQTAHAQGIATAESFDRGPGFYLSIPKLASFWLIFLLWTATTDWVSRDCVKLRLGYAVWNSVVVFVFLGAVFLFWLVPVFAAAYAILVVAYLAPLITYVVIRNGNVELHQRVLTPAHFRYLLAGVLAKVGIKIDTGYVDPHEKGHRVKITAHGAPTERDNNVNLLTARQSPAFPLLGDLLADAMEARADGIMLQYGPESVSVKYQVDGVWHDSEPQDRESGDQLLEVIKTISALNREERRALQKGAFKIQYEGAKRRIRFTSQGTEGGGERAVLLLELEGLRFQNLEEAGMRPKLREQVKAILNADQGMIVFCALPVGGLTTQIDTAVQDLDRYMRNFAAVEDKNKPERDIQNVAVTTYDGSKGESPASVLERLIRTYPDVIVVRDLVNTETLAILCEQAVSNRVIIVGLAAREAPEALLRLLAMKVPASQIAPAVTAVVNQRLIRKLCETCKEEYPATPEMLKQLGIPAGRVAAFYRPPPEPEKVCPDCDGIGYSGRTALFELLVVDDRVRNALLKEPKIDVLRRTARQAGMKALQEEGILLAAKGETSLAELSRVLKA